MPEKLGGQEAGRLESYEAMKRGSLTPYRLPAFCRELPAINWQFRAIASRLLSLPAFAIILP
jgi:hypothetical protein